MACCECHASGLFYDKRKGKCMLCPIKQAQIGTLKKQAKRGAVWAQGALGTTFLRGDGAVSKSPHDAFRWLQKAAAKGSPLAMTVLGVMYLDEDGHKRDLHQAQKYGEVLYSSDVPFIHAAGRDILNKVGSDFTDCYGDEDHCEKGFQILRRLANADDATADCKSMLGVSCYQYHNYSSALPWLVSVAMEQSCDMQLTGTMVRFAMLCCERLQLMPQAKLWMCVAERSGFDFAEEPLWKAEHSCFILKLRDLRRSCAHCGVGLTRDTRKLCKGCRTCCYCSVHCQKHHWAEGSHREECKEVIRLKEMLKK